MYKLITEVPTEVAEFYFEETLNELTGEQVEESYTTEDYNEETGEPTGTTTERTRMVAEYADVKYVRQATRPETKSMGDLERVISLGKPLHVIDKFATMVTVGEQWEFFDKYVLYLDETNLVNEFNSNLPAVSTDEEGVETFAELKELPIEPVKPVLLTLEEYKANNTSMFTSYHKAQGVEIDGFIISLNKSNSDGLVSIKTAYELVGDALFPTNFLAENPSGEVKVPLASYAEFTAFALQFLIARGAYFK